MSNFGSVLRRATVALLSLGTALGCATAHAQVAASQKIKNVLLVHGAFADGSSWTKVIPPLQAKGYHVVAVQIPLTSLADDVAAVNRALKLENGPVLLVGHSYGGVVITEAGNDPKVAGLVYVAAYALDAGESVLSVSKSGPATPLNAELRPDDSGFLKVTDEGINEDFAQDLPQKRAPGAGGHADTCCHEGHGRDDHTTRVEVEAELVHHRGFRPRDPARV